MKKCKAILQWVVVIILGVMILFNFIPMKFPTMKQYVQQNFADEYEEYICGFTVTTYGDIEASPSNNFSISEPKIFVDIDGNNPFKLLSSDFTTDYAEPTGNRFIFVGKSEVGTFYGLSEATMLHVEKWDIVYPICRKSWRTFISPRSYLNIYDYNWRNVFRSWFGKN